MFAFVAAVFVLLLPHAESDKTVARAIDAIASCFFILVKTSMKFSYLTDKIIVITNVTLIKHVCQL
ncbi:hypothetical protein Back11_55150 [Paenibacillus baekrokdamisoli]|uniref:Uncharacterized protein n=1 Tax=Paenibacillus baekrokdamisoli TaxID=1712516 RepID=A0A3G9IZ39_9BACL|nr:hypothetical protein Back11_55150 [Paenibacillus baekrokdamisoli]